MRGHRAGRAGGDQPSDQQDPDGQAPRSDSSPDHVRLGPQLHSRPTLAPRGAVSAIGSILTDPIRVF
jgi:hypothetical protein